MFIEFGHFLLILAMFICFVQIMFGAWGALRTDMRCVTIAERLAYVQFILVLASFLTLVYAFWRSDFSLLLVQLNSHSLNPLLYKVTGVWSNHEGSMLLWVLILSGFGASIVRFGKTLDAIMRARIIAVQGTVGVVFFIFILFTSSPFIRLLSPPLDGQGLNPILQDPGLAFHPPFLYLGYVGLSVCYSFAIAALWEGRVDALWGRWVRPWALVAWVFLTIGISLGSWWAYYELGWGGFWFWDPVENSSFIPWLLATALLHCAIVVEKRDALKSWTVFLAIMAFGFSLFGAFIVRSGILVSVHSFASDAARGLYLLAILGLFLGGGLVLFAVRAPVLKPGGAFDIASRESALIVNNILLSIGAFVVFLGTIWPLLAEFFAGRTLSVGPPFFEVAFIPFMIILGLFLPFGASAAWKRAKPLRIIRYFVPFGVFALSLCAMLWVLQTGRSLLGPVSVGLGSWLVAGAFGGLWLKTGRGKLGARFGRVMRVPLSEWGKTVAHAGFGVLIFAVGAVTAWQEEEIWQVTPGTKVALGHYEFIFKDVKEKNGPNYLTDQARVDFLLNGKTLAILTPEIRNYPVAGIETTEAAIVQNLLRHVYVVIARPEIGDGWVLRIFIKPFASWIWIGTFLLALGGVMSLFDGRMRIGLAQPKRAV